MGEARFLLTSSISTFASLLMVKMTTLVASVIKARLLGPDALGVLTILYSLQSMFVLFTSMALPTSLSKFIAEYDSFNKNIDIEKAFSTTMIISIVISIILTIILFTFSDLIAYTIYNREDIGYLIKIISFSIIPFSLAATLSGALQGLKKINSISKINSITALISLPIIYFLIYKMGLLGAVLTIYVGIIFTVFIMGYTLRSIFLKRHIRFNVLFDKYIFTKTMKFIWPILVSQTFIIPCMWIGKTYLSITQGFDQVGFYAISEVVAQPLLFLALSISKPLLPHWSSTFSKKNVEIDYRKIESIVNKVCIINVISTIGLLLVADYLILFLYGSQYSESIYLSSFFIIYMSISALNSTLTNFWYARGMSKFLMKIDLIGVGIFLFSLFFFINMFGSSGFALALIINASSYLFLSILHLKREGANNLAFIYLYNIFLVIFIGIIYIFVPFDQILLKIILLTLSILYVLLQKKESKEIFFLLISIVTKVVK